MGRKPERLLADAGYRDEKSFQVLEAEKTFTVEIENEESAALFSTDDGYSYVIMPLARD